MPELPEVETVCAGLRQSLKGRKLTDIELRRKDLRIPFPKDFASTLKGRLVKTIERRAKYIIIGLDSGKSIIAHLGMTGQMVVKPSKGYSPLKHDHAIIKLDDGNILVFNDARRFGLMTLTDGKALDKHPLIGHLGLEPLESGFNGQSLSNLLKGKNTSVKVALMNQELVVGVGNIYASEALFLAGISPKRPARKVNLTEAEKLTECIKKVLKDAIKAGGSSFSDYRNSEGEKGYFQHRFQVYGRNSQLCYTCKGKIIKIKQVGRSTFYCDHCQH